ncbi:MAG: RNB domain-containing ribonuclease [Methylobacillus sp.]|jgi:exoribonuclease-2|nr:RNB domain-containing ribonuclease [Methylobacillus sp.]
MNVFYEEDGSFKVASVMAENPGSLQVESVSGKRSKIKTANVLLKFEGSVAGFMEQAQIEAEKLAADFLWECCGEEEFGFEALAKDYYGRAPSSEEAAAMAIVLHAAPIYFYRKGKGRYKAAPEENLKAALAAQERKRQQAEKVAGYVAQLIAHTLPPEFLDKLDMLLYAPDKNALEWKALDEAAGNMSLTPLKLLELCGALSSAHDYHFGHFLREYFPAGTQFGTHEPVLSPDNLPEAETEAFSIDDATTTEIDDALSVRMLADGNMRIGIHIAVPALGIVPGGALDAIAMKRLSTVYMPGQKITMLPEAVITPFSLNANTWRPALSLYVDIAPDFSVVAQTSRLENVKIADNLGLDALEPHFNETNWETPSTHAYWERLALLHRFAETQEKARGKHDPNKPPQVDYNFNVEDGKIRITERKRGSPVDKLVSELMIYANAHWGGLLAENAIPGIYRAQTDGKVYMTVNADPHQGLGVAQYAWSTSPLRRAVDLVNQRQMIALLQGTEPTYTKDSDALVGTMRDFDLAYNAYGEFQTRMERHWCLVYLQQENISEIGATVWRENLVRLDGIPYFTKVHNLPELAPGSHVLLAVKRIDPLLLELDCRYQGVLE